VGAKSVKLLVSIGLKGVKMSEQGFSAEKKTRNDIDVWERSGWFWSGLFYLTLIVPAILAMRDNDLSAAEHQTVLLVTLFLTVWHGVLILYLRAQRERPGRPNQGLMLIYIGVVIIAWYVLVNITPAFYMLLFSLYGQTFYVLTLPFGIPVSLILTALVAFLQVESNDVSLGSPFVWIFILMGVAGVGFALWISRIIEQSAGRRELIEELERTQAELVSAERREGMLEERQRLAREIHDTLAQGFTSIVMQLEAAEQALSNDTTLAGQHIDQARRTARHSLEQARRVVQDLRPDLLEKDPLPVAIERVVADWSAQSGVRAQATTTGVATPLHPDIEVTLLRAVQEALVNVDKHAQAQNVNVTLSYFGDVVLLDVQDDGAGMDGTSPAAGSFRSGGFGLTAMRERVEQLGGSLHLESEPGEGTTVAIEIPLSPMEELV
jgi:signal transduction histidine kinase